MKDTHHMPDLPAPTPDQPTAADGTLWLIQGDRLTYHVARCLRVQAAHLRAAVRTVEAYPEVVAGRVLCFRCERRITPAAAS